MPIAVREEPAAQETLGEDMRVHPAVQLVTEATGGRLLNVERAPEPGAARENPTSSDGASSEPASDDGVDSPQAIRVRHSPAMTKRMRQRSRAPRTRRLQR